MTVFFTVTTWLLLASSVEVSGLIVNTRVQTNTKEENQNLTASAAEGGATAGNLSVGNVAVTAGIANESASSPSVTNPTIGAAPSEVSDRPTVKTPNPIGIGAEGATNITTPVTPKEMIPSIIQEQAGTESQLVANRTTEKTSTTASPLENTGISLANEVIKPAETSAATVVKGQPINEINEGIKATSVKSVSTSLPTSTTIRPTTTVSAVSSASSTSGDKPSTFKNVSSKAETSTNRNTSTSTGSEASTKTTVGTGSDTPKAEPSPRTTNISTSSTSTGSEASTKTTVGTGSDTPKAEPSPRTTNTSTASTSTGSEASTKTTVGTGSDTPKAEPSPRTTNTSTSTSTKTAREPSTSGNSSATTGNISSTTEISSATNGSQIPETASTTGNAQSTGNNTLTSTRNATAERNSSSTSGAGPTTVKPINNIVSTNQNKSSAVETKTPATGNDTSTLQTIPAPSRVQTIPPSSGNSTIQTIPADANNGTSTVQTIPTISKNESTIQTIPTTSISQGQRANLTTIIGDPTFVGTNEALDNSTGANGTLSDFSNSTISNATTLVPPLVPTKSELLKRRIEKDTVSIRKNLEKRAAYYKRTETRMTSLLQTIRKRNQLTQTALNHLPELLSALITEPSQRIKLSQLFAAANALQAISSSVGVESASTNNQTTVVSPNEAINATNVTV